MHIRQVTLLVLMLMLGLACEMEWGKGGFIDRSMAKDVRESVAEQCETGKTLRRSVRAPGDCLADDARDECRIACFAPGE